MKKKSQSAYSPDGWNFNMRTEDVAVSIECHDVTRKKNEEG